MLNIDYLTLSGCSFPVSGCLLARGYMAIPCLNGRSYPVNPIPYLLGGKRGVKDGYFGSKRLFCKLLIVRGKVRVRHRTETTILLPVCNRLFWLLNGCTERLIRFLNGCLLA